MRRALIAGLFAMLLPAGAAADPPSRRSFEGGRG